MTDIDLANLIEQHTGLTDQKSPEYARAYRLAHAVMTAAYESCQPESRKEFPSPAGKDE